MLCGKVRWCIKDQCRPKVLRYGADDKDNRTSKKVMTVKVEKSSNSPPAMPAGEGHARALVAKSAGDTQTASGTSVHLGATAEQLRSMENGMANTPSVSAAKVAEIKQAISEGRFQVNSGVVADSLIKAVTDLINSHKS